jgi:ParB/RepB/Spo0J family partition protein
MLLASHHDLPSEDHKAVLNPEDRKPMTKSHATEDQPMLMDLPTSTPIVIESDGNVATADGAATPSQLAVQTPLETLSTLFVIVPDTIPGVMLVDPRAIVIDPVNVHYNVAFDPDRHGELIGSMRVVGNTAPVRLRRDPGGGPGFLCLSGSRRLGSALHIQKDDPAFRLRAIIADTMTDKEAFEIAEGDNTGRSDVSAMRQARNWAEKLETIYEGRKADLIKGTGKSGSVVSRTLALLTLPDYVFACCTDVEALNPYFAEQVAPKISDPEQEPAIRRRAEALIAASRRLDGPQLVRALLNDPIVPASRPVAIWTSSDGKGSLAAKTNARGGCRIDVTDIASLSRVDRREALKAIEAILKRGGTA